MTQPNARYSSTPPVTIRDETLRCAKYWKAPTPEEIGEVLNRAGIKWEELATATNHSEWQVKEWHEGIAEIDYMAWCYVCGRAGYGQIETFDSVPNQ